MPASARALRDALITCTGADVAVVIADLYGRPDRRGAICISIGSAGMAPLRITEHDGKRQEETLTDMITCTAGIIFGQRGRGAPVVVLREVSYEASDAGVAAMLHHAPAHEGSGPDRRVQRTNGTHLPSKPPAARTSPAA
ncbi:coenzyme F420-0:L-glutamate ligase [Streptomyces anulatus]|uniref:coenzyme F420-0:L-glutamate ligase n=1 Tax=Streptomyces anulatus TaxID=1892 RepID=UPI003870DF6A|nr:coenzyme F420-0:L-glutamate ligase [Streptomyces anulatus]WTE07880.1 coenzyme F420-0:L-glutamate ligase [Streptomyces anulatus]